MKKFTLYVQTKDDCVIIDHVDSSESKKVVDLTEQMCEIQKLFDKRDYILLKSKYNLINLEKENKIKIMLVLDTNVVLNVF